MQQVRFFRVLRIIVIDNRFENSLAIELPQIAIILLIKFFFFQLILEKEILHFLQILENITVNFIKLFEYFLSVEAIGFIIGHVFLEN